MKSITEDYINLLNFAGQAPGKLELSEISFEDAASFAEEIGFDLSTIDSFRENFELAQKKASRGWTKRKDMPVIDNEDVKKLQKRLENGSIDISKPFSEDTDPGDPFPEGLSGTKADEFLKKGLKDGSEKDDKVEVTVDQIPLKELNPIQEQIYFDKSFKNVDNFGIEGTENFLQNKSFFIVSKDNFIIDGHHRFLSGILIDPEMKVNILKINITMDKLLPLSKAYGDAIGNKRNQ